MMLARRVGLQTGVAALAAGEYNLGRQIRPLTNLWGTDQAGSLDSRAELPAVGGCVQSLKRHATHLHDRLSALHARFAEQQATAGSLSPQEWEQLWQQQVKELTAAQSALRSGTKGAARLHAQRSAAAALSAVEAAASTLETTLHGAQ